MASEVLEMKPKNETELDREIEKFSGQVLKGDVTANRSEFDRVVSKRTEGLVKLPSIRHRSQTGYKRS
jgi:hypothetical protein